MSLLRRGKGIQYLIPMRAVEKALFVEFAGEDNAGSPQTHNHLIKGALGPVLGDTCMYLACIYEA